MSSSEAAWRGGQVTVTIRELRPPPASRAAVTGIEPSGPTVPWTAHIGLAIRG
jgi:hypothetical protein